MLSQFLLPPSKCANLIAVLIDHAPLFLSRSPCHVDVVATILVAQGGATTFEHARDTFTELVTAYPHIFIVEKEGELGRYMIFYHVDALKQMMQGKDSFPRSKRLWYHEKRSSGSADLKTALSEPCKPVMVELCENISNAINQPSEMEKAALTRWRSLVNEIPITEVCTSDSYAACVAGHKHSTGKPRCSTKIHLERLVLPYTDVSLGDCSYLDTCFRGKQCKYVHYRIRHPDKTPYLPVATVTEALPPQFINTNLLKFDLALLGNDYQAMIIDPPWDIHTNPNFEGGCSDAEFQKLNIKSLQTDGVLFLWVTGRVVDLGRKCLKDWGYNHVEELLWLKTNQLGRTICTGRTGHWLNHTKEHVLVGTKGSMTSTIRRMLDTDVLVSNALGKSQKPAELYPIIDRLVGSHARKLELFGRKANIRPGWITVGNELEYSQIHDPELKARLWQALSNNTSNNAVATERTRHARAGRSNR